MSESGPEEGDAVVLRGEVRNVIELRDGSKLYEVDLPDGPYFVKTVESMETEW